MAGTASADSACYNKAERQADAALRYAARLRITGLACGNFFKYQLFAQNNASRYEAAAVAMQGEDADSYDAYETALQNAESLKAASLGAPDYCHRNRSMLDDAEIASAAEVDRAITDYAAAYPSAIRACR